MGGTSRKVWVTVNALSSDDEAASADDDDGRSGH